MKTMSIDGSVPKILPEYFPRLGVGAIMLYNGQYVRIDDVTAESDTEIRYVASRTIPPFTEAKS